MVSVVRPALYKSLTSLQLSSRSTAEAEKPSKAKAAGKCSVIVVNKLFAPLHLRSVQRRGVLRTTNVTMKHETMYVNLLLFSNLHRTVALLLPQQYFICT
eukprot:scaffold133532_cov37-Prasinocladus_malaysianus.AAC.1